MTVRELIALLSTFDPEEPIWMEQDAGMAVVGSVERYAGAELLICPVTEPTTA